MRTALTLTILALALSAAAHAQRITVGAGMLLSNRASEPVGELHADFPLIPATRANLTLSWTDDSAKPSIISEVERTIVAGKAGAVGAGAGFLWLDANDYRPYPILVSSTVVALPVPRTSVVMIAGTQPFQDWAWAVVVKVGVTLLFVR